MRLQTFIAPFAALAIGWPGASLSRAPVIDVHVHTSARRTGLAADILAANGISRFVNLSGGSPGDGLEGSLAAAAAMGGRVVVCVNLRLRRYAQPDFAEGEVEMLSKAVALGARCLKIPKALGLYIPLPEDPDRLMPVDDPRLAPIFQAAGSLGLPVFIHTGDPKAFFEPMGPKNERMAELGVHPGWSFHDARFPRRDALLAARDRVLARHRQTTFIGVHFANNPEDLAYVDAALSAHPNLMVDIAARLPEIGRHAPAKVKEIFTRHQDRILFGTDLGITRGLMLGSVGRKRPGLPDVFLFYADHFRYLEGHERQIPHPTPIQGDWRIDAIGLPADVLEKIYNRNALRLFWGESAPTALDAQALELSPTMVDFFESP